MHFTLNSPCVSQPGSVLLSPFFRLVVERLEKKQRYCAIHGLQRDTIFASFPEIPDLKVQVCFVIIHAYTLACHAMILMPQTLPWASAAAAGLNSRWKRSGLICFEEKVSGS